MDNTIKRMKKENLRLTLVHAHTQAHTHTCTHTHTSHSVFGTYLYLPDLKPISPDSVQSPFFFSLFLLSWDVGETRIFLPFSFTRKNKL